MYLSTGGVHDVLPSIVTVSMRMRAPTFERGGPVRGAKPCAMIISLDMPVIADSTIDAHLCHGNFPNAMYDIKHGTHCLRH